MRHRAAPLWGARTRAVNWAPPSPPDAVGVSDLPPPRTLQRLAAEMDARGHLTAARDEFRKVAMEKGIKEVVRIRDEPFGDGLVRF